MTGETMDGEHLIRHVCAVCGRVLDYSDLRGWTHTQQDPDDHPVVAVTDDQVPVRDRCDFCSGEPTVSFIVSVPLKMVGLQADDSVVPLRRTDASWACCAACDRLIRRGDWKKVTRRALVSLAASDEFGGVVRPEVAQALRSLHRTVAAGMVGDPVRLDGDG